MSNFSVGDLVSHEYSISGFDDLRYETIVGIVTQILEPSYDDRGMRIYVKWQLGGFSYEKESDLKKLGSI